MTTGERPPELPARQTPAHSAAHTSGIAVASLVLAIVAFFSSALAIGVLPGLAAIICGHAARYRIRMAALPLRGAELAAGGLIAGYLSVTLGLLSGWFVVRPAWNRWWNEPTRVEVRRSLAEVEGKDARAVRETVVRLLGEGHQAAAEEMLDEVLPRYDHDQRLHFARGVLRRSRWNKKATAWSMRRVVAGGATTVEGRCAALCLAMDEADLTEEAVNRLAALVDGSDHDPFALWLLALQCREYHRQTSSTRFSRLAEEAYRKLLKHFPVAPVMVNQTYANIIDELGRHEDALAYRLKAVAQEPTGWTYQGLANTYNDLHRYVEADRAYRKCLECDASDADYWRQWGESRSDAGVYDEAIAKYRKAIELAPDDPLVYHSWGRALQRQGKYADALAVYGKSAALGSGAAYTEIGVMYARGQGMSRDNVKAAQYYADGVKHGDATAAENLAHHYQEGNGVKRDCAKAVGYFQRAIELRHHDVSTASMVAEIGRCYRDGESSIRDRAKAAHYFRQAADMGDVEAASDLAWLYATMESLAGVDARDMIDRAEKLPRDNPYYADTVAAVYARAGDFTNAVAQQRVALDLMQRKHVGKSTVKEAEQRLELYRSGRSYSE